MTASEQTEKARRIADTADLLRLREPFEKSQIGLLPQPYKKDSARGDCSVCGKYHGLPAMHLDFVGHAAVTARLLDVDPLWTWEPLGLTDEGLPALDKFGNLWIRLTVCGVTRLGVGDGPSMKVCIGDALRNAAMRFGVALDLWMRGQEDDKTTGDHEAPKEPEPPLPDGWDSWDELNVHWDELKTATGALSGEEADEVKGALKALGFSKLTFTPYDADAWENLLPAHEPEDHHDISDVHRA